MLRIITLLYHLYIEYEMYHMEYNKIKNNLTENIFIGGKMSKWDDNGTFRIIKGNKNIDYM